MLIRGSILIDKYGNEWTHKGLFCGIAPIYLKDPLGECAITARHWALNWLLDLTESMVSLYVQMGFEFNAYPIKITGEI